MVAGGLCSVPPREQTHEWDFEGPWLLPNSLSYLRAEILSIVTSSWSHVCIFSRLLVARQSAWQKEGWITGRSDSHVTRIWKEGSARAEAASQTCWQGLSLSLTSAPPYWPSLHSRCQDSCYSSKHRGLKEGGGGRGDFAPGHIY